jgi:type II secretory pathway component PulJ
MKYHSGTTLLEIVVALSLGSLLLVALSGVSRAMHRQNQSVRFEKLEDVRHELQKLLWNDLSQARAASMRDGAFWLELPSSAIDSQGGTQFVSYQIRESKGLPIRLVRTEARANATVSQERVQTVLWNLSAIQFERVDAQGVSQPIPQSMGPAPVGIRYALWLNRQDVSIRGEVNVR